MPLRVRTSVEIAKAIITRLAAIPTRFQPIRSLKPRPSAANSRTIRPPGRAATALPAFFKETNGFGCRSLSETKHIRQKRLFVQSLTKRPTVAHRPHLKLRRYRELNRNERPWPFDGRRFPDVPEHQVCPGRNVGFAGPLAQHRQSNISA